MTSITSSIHLLLGRHLDLFTPPITAFLRSEFTQIISSCASLCLNLIHSSMVCFLIAVIVIRFICSLRGPRIGKHTSPTPHLKEGYLWYLHKVHVSQPYVAAGKIKTLINRDFVVIFNCRLYILLSYWSYICSSQCQPSC